jgi:hypothetical protein
MSLLPAMILYLAVGCGEWYLALRRTLACARGEKAVLVSIVFIENLLGLWVLSNFVRTNNWFLALSYAAGGSAGALIVAMYSQEKPATPARSSLTRARRHTRTRSWSFWAGVTEYAARLQPHHRRPTLQRRSRRVACSDG